LCVVGESPVRMGVGFEVSNTVRPESGADSVPTVKEFRRASQRVADGKPDNTTLKAAQKVHEDPKVCRGPHRATANIIIALAAPMSAPKADRCIRGFAAYDTSRCSIIHLFESPRTQSVGATLTCDSTQPVSAQSVPARPQLAAGEHQRYSDGDVK
jgi:hypothetical protein